MLNHLGGGAGGIEHFYEQFAKPLATWWTPLSDLEFTPEVQLKMIDGLHAEVEGRSLQDLAAERDQLLLTLLKARQARQS